MNKLINILSVSRDEIKVSNVFSKEFKIAVVSTFVIGLIAHMFVFTNPIFGHDGAHMYWLQISIEEASAGGRWLVPFWQGALKNIFQPWLCGFLTLFFYSIASHFICKYLYIERAIPIALVCGIMVTAPTVISSNMYLSSSYIYAIALLLAVLAVYCYDNVKYGRIYCLLFMLLCAATYTAYISFGISLFIVHSIIDFLRGKCKFFSKELKRQFFFVTNVLLSIMLNVMILVKFGKQEAIRGVELTAGSGTSSSLLKYIESARATYQKTLTFFSPGNNISYFQEERLLFFLFIIVFIITVIFSVIMIIQKRLIKENAILIMAVDILALPLAMDVVNILYESHVLMQAAYILPWIMFIAIYESVCTDLVIVEKINCRRVGCMLGVVYTSLVLLLSVYTISNRVLLANVAYTKAYGNYEAGISYANRIVTKIESIDGYIPGKTKVLFVGKVEGSNHQGVYEFVGDMTGIGSNFANGYWDTALPGTYVLKAFINQQLAVDMDILGPIYYIDSEEAELILKQMNGSFEGISAKIDTLEAYSQDEGYILQDDVLIFKLK